LGACVILGQKPLALRVSPLAEGFMLIVFGIPAFDPPGALDIGGFFPRSTCLRRSFGLQSEMFEVMGYMHLISPKACLIEALHRSLAPGCPRRRISRISRDWEGEPHLRPFRGSAK
jgi:hypothetical protein